MELTNGVLKHSVVKLYIAPIYYTYSLIEVTWETTIEIHRICISMETTL